MLNLIRICLVILEIFSKKCDKFILAPVEFTDEEGYGKYLDLHECYEKYINLKGIEVNQHFL